MKRRELIKNILYGSGVITINSSVFSLLTSCHKNEDLNFVFFNNNQFSFLNELTEIIIPKSETPGAKEIRITNFIDLFLYKTLDDKAKYAFKTQLKDLIIYLEKKYKKEIIDLTKNEISDELVLGFKKENSNYQILDQIRNLTVFSYKTSEYIGKNILNYNPNPGYQLGCINLNEMENKNAWTSEW
ncbi:MAG: gluconate 2-dehydrogenase subunit 3 family protein [Flavobacteriales bacterium]|jgi:hypothetical protein|tara:strand:+ start:69 stop:626 length:558 start_codon:yes stop_codon:yes gene_type:complete